jgi:DNA-binding response OmpR family regulator
MKSSHLQDETRPVMTSDPFSPTETPIHKIMVVEDDEEMRRLLFEELEEAGFQVSQAENGKEALAQIEASNPELVISDFHVPDGGLDFLRALREKCGSCRIVVVTAMRDDITRHEVEQQGVDAFLGKPIRISHLIETIEGLLRQ